MSKLFNSEEIDELTTGRKSPLVSLEQDLKLYNDAINEVSLDIMNEGLSEFPIFIAHYSPVSLGELILDKDVFNTKWSVSATTMEELLEKNIITEDKEKYFISNYKDPYKYMCMLVVVPEGANFVYYPYLNN